MKSLVIRFATLAVLTLGSIVAAGCATVQPWQRGTLADPCMVFDADRQDVSYQTHWQESREGSMGGFGVQGGGCGCK
jgi:hypothetical protein